MGKYGTLFVQSPVGRSLAGRAVLRDSYTILFFIFLFSCVVAPIIVSPPKKTECFKNTPFRGATFHCTVAGYPFPAVTWQLVINSLILIIKGLMQSFCLVVIGIIVALLSAIVVVIDVMVSVPYVNIQWFTSAEGLPPVTGS